MALQIGFHGRASASRVGRAPHDRAHRLVQTQLQMVQEEVLSAPQLRLLDGVPISLSRCRCHSLFKEVQLCTNDTILKNSLS